MSRTDASALPEGWKMVAFGDVVRQVKDSVDPEASGLQRFVAGEHMNTDDLHIRDWGTIGDGYLGPAFHRRFKKGQVLYGSRRTYLRKVAVANFDGICANTTFVLEPKDDQLLPELLPFVMQTDTFNDHAVKQSRGSVNPYVNFRDIAWYTFPLPPKEEQRRIADILWAADAAVERWRAVEQELRVAQAAFAHDRIYAAGYGSVPIGTVAAVSNGTTPSRSNPGFWEGGTIPWIPTGKVHERVITSADEFITEQALKDCSLRLLPEGTVLIAMIGQGKTRGSVARLAIPAAINQNFAAIVPGETVDARYLYFSLSSSYEALRRASQGSSQGALNCTIVSGFRVPLPDRCIQERIAETLNSFEECLACICSHLETAVSARERLVDIVLQR